VQLADQRNRGRVRCVDPLKRELEQPFLVAEKLDDLSLQAGRRKTVRSGLFLLPEVAGALAVRY